MRPESSPQDRRRLEGPHTTRPLQVVLERGQTVESVHEVCALACHENGDILFHYGPPDFVFFPRSSVKLIQALPLVCHAPDLATPQELALACASHHGEAPHIQLLKNWLQRLELSEQSLRCGLHPPMDSETRRQLWKEAQPISVLHNNCSGKHIGFLACCLRLKWDMATYLEGTHPLQQAVKKELETFGDLHLDDAKQGLDGCSIPAFPMPLYHLARLGSRFSKEVRSSRDTALSRACRRIFEAVTQHPELVGGRKAASTHLMQQSQKPLLAKNGAEGVFLLILPALQLSIALKARDGSDRAAQHAAHAILAERTAWLAPETPTLYNWNGLETGRVRTLFPD